MSLNHTWTPEQLRFLEWYLQPRSERAEDEKTQEHLAVKLNRHVQTIQGWRKQPWFQAELSQGLTKMNAGPERVQEVVDAMFEAAKNGDTKAAALYLQFINRLKPPEQKVIIEDKRVQELTDDELKAILDGGSARDVLA